MTADQQVEDYLRKAVIMARVALHHRRCAALGKPYDSVMPPVTWGEAVVEARDTLVRLREDDTPRPSGDDCDELRAASA